MGNETALQPKLLDRSSREETDRARTWDGAVETALPWLVRLRWAAVVGLAITTAGFRLLFPVDLPLIPIAALIAAMGLTNAALPQRLAPESRPRRGLMGAVVALDVLLVTGILYLTGGPTNPISVVYLLQIAVAAIALGSRWTWVVALLSVAGYGSLFLSHRPLHFTTSGHGADANVHLVGMWVAFGATAALMAYFIGRVSSALAAREEELLQMRALADKQQRVTALLTLGAGAAHELASPLSTIAVAARELERHLAEVAPGQQRLMEDTGLIRSEIDRCRAILDRLSGRATADTDSRSAVEMGDLLDELGRGLRPEQRARLDVSCDPEAVVYLPRAALLQALVSLVSNAFEASASEGRIKVSVSCGADLTIVVRDIGRGMTSSALARAGEPFYTTKTAGLGLGLFLVRAFAEGVRGRLQLESAEGSGTTATLRLPLAL